jgi:hypothetical protein
MAYLGRTAESMENNAVIQLQDLRPGLPFASAKTAMLDGSPGSP